jgi:secondary thiamine-phosphate synthase enzyme
MRFEIEVETKVKDDFVDITSQVRDCVRESEVQNGICVVFVPHATAGLTVNENWDPSVKADVLTTLDRLVPWRANYRHVEGNAAAHIKSCLTGVSETMLVDNGSLMLGSWQGIFLAEFHGPRRRRVLVRVIPDSESA